MSTSTGSTAIAGAAAAHVMSLCNMLCRFVFAQRHPSRPLVFVPEADALRAPALRLKSMANSCFFLRSVAHPADDTPDIQMIQVQLRSLAAGCHRAPAGMQYPEAHRQ